VKQLAIISAALFVGLIMIAPASASTLCTDTTDCTLDFTQGNSSSGFGTGDFGTLNLDITATNVITVTVDLNTGWDIILTGFPGSFGFTDSLSGTPTIGGFSSTLYSGSTTDTTENLHFDGFGSFSDAAATTGPHNGAGLQSVSFTVTQAGLNNVNDLLNLSSGGGDGTPYFVVDAGIVGASTGLLGVFNGQTTVPEPSYSFLLVIFGAAVWVAQRRMKASTVS
jgi:hypothetical protein